jgi:predicted nucleotidyltransferase
MDTRQLVQTRRDEILRIAASHGASNLRIFGSVARGDSKPGCDIDFLVHLEPGRSLLDHVALMQGLEDLLGHKIDVVTEDGLHEMVREQVLKEAIFL